MIVLWRVTTHCNLGCAYCAYDRNLSLPRVDVDADSVVRLARLLAEYQLRTGDAVMISWLGGEPLLWKPLASISKLLSTELGLQLSATTNGTALKSATLRQMIVEHFAELTVSVDGPQPFHDHIRQWPGGFEQLRASVMKLRADTQHRERRLRLRVNTVLMAQNIHRFGELCEQLISWGIDEITFNQLGGNDRPEFHRTHRLQPADVEALAHELPKLRDRLLAHGVRLSGGAQYLHRFRASASGERLPVSSCHPGQKFLFVDEQGRVAPCSFTLTEYGVPVDELRSLDDLMGLSERYAGALEQRRSRWCDDCPSTQVFEKFVA
ncbi:radical SAM protein [Steroidobacter sp.]|uniref:radical SAM protein n=1 Tax=Steroidobacter sp. TaxID=1978227 RepID=UPI001A3F4694|nr:radical SAM protein [Steroidobacter sp.]MBL8266251.1 radical SAM protein [Steroidobacter sp.]